MAQTNDSSTSRKPKHPKEMAMTMHQTNGTQPTNVPMCQKRARMHYQAFGPNTSHRTQ